MRRMVSAYIDKFVRKLARNEADMAGPGFYREVGRTLGRPVTPASLTFEDFVEFSLALPDRRTNQHYRTQSAFLDGREFDFYGDVADLAGTLDFLEAHGMNTDIGGVKSPKRTHYADTTPEVSAARMTPVELNALPSYPAAAAFFDAQLLERFLEKYEADVALYARTRGLDRAALLAPYRDG
jgi:hypothetical protein